MSNGTISYTISLLVHTFYPVLRLFTFMPNSLVCKGTFTSLVSADLRSDEMRSDEM